MEHISEKQPLCHPNIQLLEKILKGIVDKELSYDPKHRHNKDSHNIGGWAEVFYYESLGYTYNSKDCTFTNKENDTFNAYEGYGYNKLMAILGLTPQEAAVLNNYPPPFEMQFKLLDLLKLNIRIKGYFVEEDLADKADFRVGYYDNGKLIFPPLDPDPPVLIRQLHQKLVSKQHE